MDSPSLPPPPASPATPAPPRNPLLLPGIITGAVVLVLLLLIIVLSTGNNKPAGPDQTTNIEAERTTIPYEEETIEDANLFTDDHDVLAQVGINGVIEDRYNVTRDRNDTILKKELIDTTTVIEKQNRILRKGTLDRTATSDAIKGLMDEYLAYLKKHDFTKLYPMLRESDRMLYTESQLKNSAEGIDFLIESYSLVQDLRYEYPVYLTSSDSSLQATQDTPLAGGDTTTQNRQGLVAVLPLRVIFTSTIGRQELAFDLRFIHENDSWKATYFGPAEIVAINKTQKRDDGGKTYGKPVSAEITLKNAIFFPNLNRVYIDYQLSNTSEANYTTGPLGVQQIIVTNAKLSSVTLYDDPQTGYQLKENVFFLQAYSDVYIGESAIGRLQFTPVPGPDISQIYVTLQLQIGNYMINVDFGDISLDRQNRQAQYLVDNSITDPRSAPIKDGN